MRWSEQSWDGGHQPGQDPGGWGSIETGREPREVGSGSVQKIKQTLSEGEYRESLWWTPKSQWYILEKQSLRKDMNWSKTVTWGACSILEGTCCLLWVYKYRGKVVKNTPKILPHPSPVVFFFMFTLLSFLFCASPWGQLCAPPSRPYFQTSLVSLPVLFLTKRHLRSPTILWRNRSLAICWVKLTGWLVCDFILMWSLGMKSASE